MVMQIIKMCKEQKKLIAKKNKPLQKNNGLFTRWQNPVLTRAHIPLEWRFDLDSKTNPYLIENLGINAVFNSGAIYYNNKFLLMPRVEGTDRKSFFAICESDNGVDNFKFWDEPVIFDKIGVEVNLYDMRLTLHEDGYIYGVFCSESLDEGSASDFQAVASTGIIRTKDLINFERLPNLSTKSPQQRNCVLHPEFVNGCYLFYTRPQDGFIEAGEQGGICTGFVKDILNPVIEEEKTLFARKYHTIYETKNGAGIVPIKTDKGYIHIAHGVRNTAAGLRYVLYAFGTDYNDPTKTIAIPSGYLMSPLGEERVGDVSNVLFTNGAIVKDKTMYLYYASSDTRLHVATFNLDALKQYIFNGFEECYDTHSSTLQRINLIKKNKLLGEKV